MTISYSKRADVLYITLESSEASCAYIEVGMGMVLRVDEGVGRVVGVTIRDFLRHVQDGDDLSVPLLNQGIPIESLLQCANAE